MKSAITIMAQVIYTFIILRVWSGSMSLGFYLTSLDVAVCQPISTAIRSCDGLLTTLIMEKSDD
tara:strand:+ start:56 stop:247 length:192 start_codon:yes stop_codon:yes gene_type:complete